MVEVRAKCYAGPFEEIPYANYIQLPVGLVPKDKGTETRLIFHLSYPKSRDSVNSAIPDCYCKVRYPTFDQAVELCVKAGRNCKIAKSDISKAFRNALPKPEFWKFLILKTYYPKSGKLFYFVEKCVPFGSASSCKIFQEISDGIAFIVTSRMQKLLVNYLDDYFFIQLVKYWCDQQVAEFIRVCEELGFPVALEKMVWGMTVVVFLGMMLDTEK